MLFALAVLCFLLVNVGANECQCDLEGETTTCKIPMWTIVRESREDLEWDLRMYERAKQEAEEEAFISTPDYKTAWFWEGLKKNDKRPMEQKVNMTMDRNESSKRMKVVRPGAKFGCYCEHKVGDLNDDMMIYCFFH